ncbi:MAG TPA: hypothetical protein VMV86_01780, partial [Methanosarcinales archaeon]|nr:hypothetical protein [Methanosarcinales archaeon]
KLNPLTSVLYNNTVSVEDIWQKFYRFVAVVPANNKSNVIEAIDLAEKGEAKFSTTGVYIKNYDIPTENSTTSLKRRVGTGGRRYFLHVNRLNGQHINDDSLLNYVRPINSDSLYGGQSDAAKANSVYMSTGHYLKIDAALLADIYDSSTGKYVLNGMQVFGGDCFVNLYDRVHVVQDNYYNASSGSEVYNWTGTKYADKGDGSWSYIAIFPCESNLNVALREGKHGSKDGSSASISGAIAIDSTAVQHTGYSESYAYNTAYSSQKVHIPYTALPTNFTPVSDFPYMARYSELKTLGEPVDNMRKFLLGNFKNADALHGPIVGGAVGGDKLFYIQERGVGYFPIEEREVIPGAILGSALQIGVGGLMLRADNVDRFYGSQHTSSIYTAEDHFGFFDFKRKTQLVMSFNGGVEDVAVVKGRQSFFANAFKAVATLANNISTREDLLNGYGITSVYDSRHKMALVTFKFRDSINIYDFTVGFSSQLKAYVGNFSFVPALYVEHNHRLYSPDSTDNVSTIQANTNYIIKQKVAGINNNNYYVCITDYTTGTIFVAPELDTVNWALGGTLRDVSQYWEGDICKFFGVTYPFELEVVSKGAITKSSNDTKAEKVFDSVEAYGNDTPFTDVYYEDSERTASDININSKSKDFKYIDSSWWWNVALSNKKERMLDHYIKIKVVVKNFVTNPVNSLNKVKRIVYLRTVYRKKL